LAATSSLGSVHGATSRAGGGAHPTPRRTRKAAIAAAFVAGGVAGALVVPVHYAPHARDGASAPGLPAVTLDGKPLPRGSGPATLEAARAIARSYVRGSITVRVPAPANSMAKKLPSSTSTREALGAHVDDAWVSALVRDAADPRAGLVRLHPAARGPLALPMPVTVDPDRGLSAVLQLKDELDRTAADARFERGSDEVVPEVPGFSLDVYATLARLEDAVVRGDAEVEAAGQFVPARLKADALRQVHVEDVLAYFETRYERDAKHEARSFNLAHAASKLDGTVLFPGEVFDFNEVVGPRTEVNGYKVAPVIAQGELVDGIGGGTCQVAGTLHAAAFFAGLDILERHPHTRPSAYIKMGLDAAVAYPTIDLKFRNPYAYPVVVREIVQGGTVRAEIVGPKRTRDVTFVRRIDEAIPFVEREVDDARVPRGQRVLAQRGTPGFKVTRFRIVRDGPFAVREKTEDTIPPVPRVWKIGTGEPNPAFESEDDPHPEYLADEWLTISQGPSVVSPKAKKYALVGAGTPDEPGGGSLESRTPGRFGVAGWSEAYLVGGRVKVAAATPEPRESPSIVLSRGR
jgi:vancomycin resistance protein YoaR